MKEFSVPQLALILLMGPSGAGKSTFARRVFLPTECVSSDFCRGLVSDDENDQTVSAQAFELLHSIVAQRLQLGRLTVVDATNVQAASRASLLAIARRYHVLPVAIAFDLPETVCQERNRARPDRDFGPHVIRNHRRDLHRSMRNLRKEGFRHVHVLRTPEDVDSVSIQRVPVWNDLRALGGPFDIIGDVHGCYDELLELLGQLGEDGGRKVIFLGDLVDRGPRTPDVLRLVMRMVAEERALCLPGNHDIKLLRHLQGKRVQLTHGLDQTVEQLSAEPADWVEEVKKFLDGLVSHYVLDGGRLVVAHAGLKSEMHGRTSATVREFCLYGETTGETDEFGLPVRYNWASEYRGKATVVYGHTPVLEPEWLNQTINIDTGCVFGGHLTALRYPELQLVRVVSRAVYAEPARPLGPAPVAEDRSPNLDLADFAGRRTLHTRFARPILIQEENAIAALETLSRFSVDPRWLIYLPPTMSPSETSSQEGYLEHPEEALESYRSQGVPRVICQEKHMGSRAVVVVCRDRAAVSRQFWDAPGLGAVYTRTGRSFFDRPELETQLLDRLRAAVESAGLWKSLSTDWLCLDCELMPWSLKAGGLLRQQYAGVGSAAVASLEATVAALRAASSPLLERFQEKLDNARAYRTAYRAYCWAVQDLEGVRLAPFHLMASEKATHFHRDHTWHLEQLAGLGRHDALFGLTRSLEVDLAGRSSEAVTWWLDLTAHGGEGMVIKPLQFLTQAPNLLQPAIKCRGREYLRIIYGPDYTMPENLERLRKRGLNFKRKLALREFCLGLEGLERFVAHESLTRVHESVFGVLSLESEPVDPRL